MNFLLCHCDVLWSISGDEDLLGVSSISICRAVSIDLREGRWKINCRVCCRLDNLDVLSGPTAYDCVQGEFEHGSIYNTSELQFVSYCSGHSLVDTYESINKDQNSSLCVFSTLHISVNGYSPSLISSCISQALRCCCEFRPKKKNVDATE